MKTSGVILNRKVPLLHIAWNVPW